MQCFPTHRVFATCIQKKALGAGVRTNPQTRQERLLMADWKMQKKGSAIGVCVAGDVSCKEHGGENKERNCYGINTYIVLNNQGHKLIRDANRITLWMYNHTRKSAINHEKKESFCSFLFAWSFCMFFLTLVYFDKTTKVSITYQATSEQTYVAVLLWSQIWALTCFRLCYGNKHSPEWQKL